MFRRTSVPHRTVGHEVVAARPLDGEAVLLGATAALVWGEAHDWVSEADLAATLASLYPEVTEDERSGTLAEILTVLSGEGLLERPVP